MKASDKPYNALSIMNGNSSEAKRTRTRHKNQYWSEREREEYECPHCGRGFEEVERFEVHHRDGNPLNGDSDNLVALCRECHYREHDREPPESLEQWKQRINNELQ